MNPATFRPPAAGRFALASLLGTAASILSPTDRAVAYLWTGGSATSANWSDAANWGPDGTPVSSGDTALVFTGSSRLANTQDLASPLILNSLAFDADDGILQAGQSSASFLQNLSAAYVQGGGARIDTSIYDVYVAQPLLHDPALGATADGGLTKLGAANLFLTGANTYTGRRPWTGAPSGSASGATAAPWAAAA